MLIEAPGKAKVHLFFWTVVCVVGVWGFWTRATWWAQLLMALLTLWAWSGITASARALKHGFYDIDQPETPEEKALAAKSSYLPIPLALLTLLLLLKLFVFRR
ncbi:MAG TPA: hypothetical protein VLA96_12230 [Terriglobales bacterium]|nr:hypothetical protein [Terriglobales bacterium]